MGHQIGKAHHPHRGSQAFIPRVRARRHFSRINNWPKVSEARILGFAAYKAGMSHVSFTDNAPNSPTKGELISVPVTILDVPKTKVIGIRIYAKNKRRQKVCIKEIQTDKLDKELARRICLPKKKKDFAAEMKAIDEAANSAEDVKLVVCSIPESRFNKKKPDIYELAVGGKSAKEKYDFAKTFLGKELSAKDVLKQGEQVDIIAVTKGKGFQGPVKRNGVKIQPRNKSDSSSRSVASIGPDVPRKVNWRIAMPGQMGCHNRYDYNKWILKIGADGKEINPVQGFLEYGLVPKEYIMIMGSLPGARKRLIRMRVALRPRKNIPAQAPEIQTVSRVNL